MENWDPYGDAHRAGLRAVADSAWWRGWAWGCIVGSLLACGVTATFVLTLGRPCLP